jgi:hypothetical protein
VLIQEDGGEEDRGFDLGVLCAFAVNNLNLNRQNAKNAKKGKNRITLYPLPL